MTNHWADMANSTNVVVMGANPVENHPASIAHINNARAGGTGHAKANMLVIDPRKTRTALQADTFVRMRPGTDIAIVNGLVRYIINWMESNPADPRSINFFTYLNQGATDGAVQSFFPNKAVASTGASTLQAAVKYGSKFTDSRFLVSGSDYLRESVSVTGDPLVGGETPAAIIYDFPKKSTDCKTQVTVPVGDPGGAAAGTYDTVYLKLKAHVAPYTPAVVEDISGVSATELDVIAMSFINNSRCNSFNPSAPTTIINDPSSPYFRCTTMLYAMGITQHTVGSQNVKSFAVLQTLMGNMGRYGGGINALRGIHNVQGSTDMGLLYGNIPAYSGNPTLAQQPSTDANGFGKYMDALWGTPLSGSGGKAAMDGTYADAYVTGQMALQQRGFYNMTQKFFGTPDTLGNTAAADKTKIDALFSLWPKGNGDDHRIMFRKMITGATKVLISWGQNPAVTEPNQGAIRSGLRNLDLLVVTDMFETETAACDRKSIAAGDLGDGITYLIPAASHVEVGGSATNSGRTLQWRYQARKPAGNSKSDLELLFRLAYALDGAGAFSHISAAWTAAGVTGTTVYDKLYGSAYANGWNPLSATAFEDVTATVTPAVQVVAATGNVVSTPTVTGCEFVAEMIYREMCKPSGSGGTIWIYTGAYNDGATWTGDNIPGGVTGPYGGWTVNNRAKSRNRTNTGTYASHGWGYSWLVNRRVLYNNNASTYPFAGEAPGDTNDLFMGPDSCSRLFVSTNAAVLNYSRWYRTIHRLSDVPKNSANAVPAIHVLPGRFPAHTEPYETPRTDWETWGKNSTGTYMNLLPVVAGSPTTPVGAPAAFPLVLTTVRCVEHFQGGPITRNNWFNVELEPEPWIELNSSDAMTYGVKDGDYVKIVTARTEDLVNNQMPNYGSGFRARVGSGLAANQKVGKGVVAIPWHWGETGLSTGSRANDLCIDAGDANTTIPESKACLCRIEKI
jgi:anaerobic selenocysteine-containing dehydrogenase